MISLLYYIVQITSSRFYYANQVQYYATFRQFFSSSDSSNSPPSNFLTRAWTIFQIKISSFTMFL